MATQTDIVVRLDTQKARLKLIALGPQLHPHWLRLSAGRFIGLHVAEQGRAYWRARLYVPASKKYLFESLGECIDGTFEYDAAVLAAQAWFDASSGVRRGPYTVADACRDLITRKLADSDHLDGSRRAELARLFERIVLGSAPDQTKGRIYPRDPIADVAMTETDLTAGVVNAWLMRRKDRTINGRKSKPSSVNHDYKKLRAALNGAVSGEHASATVAKAWTCEHNKPFKVMREEGRRNGYLTRTQIDAWIAQLTDRTAADLLTAQYLTGSRPGKELNQIRRADFDEVRGVLTIRNGKTKFRKVALSDDALALFKRLAKDCLPGAFLFTRADGSPVDTYTYRDHFKKAAKRAGLPASTVPYCLRHSFITDAVAERVSETDIATHCGTSVEMIKKHYFTQNHQSLAATLTRMQSRRAA